MRNLLLCALIVGVPATGRADAPIPLRDFFKSDLRDLTLGPKVRAEIVDHRPDDDHKLLVGLNQRNPGVFDVYRINAAEKFIVDSFSDRTRGSRYLYDVKTRRLTKLADVVPWLDGFLGLTRPSSPR